MHAFLILQVEQQTCLFCLQKNRVQSSDFKGQMIHSDINLSMLNIGRDKLIDQGIFIPSILCDAESLPFPDNYFDCVTIGFGIRNMTDKKEH